MMKNVISTVVMMIGMLGTTAIASQDDRQANVQELFGKYVGAREVNYADIFSIEENRAPDGQVSYRIVFKCNPDDVNIFIEGGVRNLRTYFRWRGVDLPHEVPLVLTGEQAAKVHQLLGEIEKAILFVMSKEALSLF